MPTRMEKIENSENLPIKHLKFKSFAHGWKLNQKVEMSVSSLAV